MTKRSEKLLKRVRTKLQNIECYANTHGKANCERPLSIFSCIIDCEIPMLSITTPSINHIIAMDAAEDAPDKKTVMELDISGLGARHVTSRIYDLQYLKRLTILTPTSIFSNIH